MSKESEHERWREVTVELAELTVLIEELQEQLIQLQELRRPRRFIASLRIEEALNLHEGAASVFKKHHLPNCSLCVIRFEESLKEAAEAYEIDLKLWLYELNLLLQ